MKCVTHELSIFRTNKYESKINMSYLTKLSQSYLLTSKPDKYLQVLGGTRKCATSKDKVNSAC